jgi:hypothetical protein
MKSLGEKLHHFFTAEFIVQPEAYGECLLKTVTL